MSQQASRYFVPDPSHFPLVGSAALFLLASGAVLWMNKFAVGPYVDLHRHAGKLRRDQIVGIAQRHARGHVDCDG